MGATNNVGAEGGFRLRVLEIFNWGTFDSKVYKLQPDGKTSLLIGANGSGKTTLIDALLTLIVPSNKRFYNQSSGAEFKKERDEKSYFWGYYGRSYSDAEDRPTIEQLRDKNNNPYSVLLASFQNSPNQQTVCLVQIRWFSSGELRKVYIVAPYQLNINDHFGKGNFDFKGEWKRRLLKQFPKTDVFESFKDYSTRFSDLFGLKEKALSLFNQTVGIKVLGDLNIFIRQQMLEDPNSDEQFNALHSHYTDLLASHKAIKKDEKQLELLLPIVENKSALQELNEKLSHLHFIKEQLPAYFNKRESELIREYVENLKGEIVRLSSLKKQVQQELTVLESQKEELISQKASMDVDVQVQLLKKDISSETEKRETKKNYFDQYQRLAAALGFQGDVDPQLFDVNLKAANTIQKQLEVEFEFLQDKRAEIKIENGILKREIAEAHDEVSSLSERQNRIPRDLIAARKALSQFLELNENELPFVGELIKINNDERHWEDVIERILHSFSMRLLVPDRHIKYANQFAYANDLKTKLVYERIDRKTNQGFIRRSNEVDSLVNKIEVKEAIEYASWIDQQLNDRYNYICTDDLDTFNRSTKAATSNGLVRNVGRHEKDDRPLSWNKAKYRLGWENKETIQFLLEQKHLKEDKLSTLTRLLEDVQSKVTDVDHKKTILISFLIVKSFSEIDWKSHAKNIEVLSRRLQEITSSNDLYQTILKQLTEVGERLTAKRKESENLAGELNFYDKEIRDKEKKIQLISNETMKDEHSIFVSKFINEMDIDSQVSNDLEGFETFKKRTAGVIDGLYEDARKKSDKKKMETVNNITQFVRPESKIIEEFPDWNGDTLNISATLESLDELDDLYTKIKNQRLVEHKKRFQDYMDRSMLDALTNYRAWLINEEDRIKEVISELNVPLKKITFNKNPDTYLQLECKTTRDPEMKAFKEQLNSTIPNALEFTTRNDENYRNSIFEKIRDLITALRTEEPWRKRVTDIRNWLTFSAREYYLSNNLAGYYHDNTASYSGGQKAQFTYAILGAAISHQFGINEPGRQNKSLRFITVDEAFSKLDPEKSQFLMEFCAQLNLQLLVVTPLDKINVAEPFINAVHFVEIKNKKQSVIYNLTMQEYESRKDEFKQLAKLDDNT